MVLVKKGFIATVCMGMIFFIAIAYSTVLFNNTVNKELEQSIKLTLVDLANQQQLSLNRQLESMIFNLTSVAETLPIIGVDEGGILDYVKAKQEALNLKTVLIVDNQGTAFVDDGKLYDVSQSPYFDLVMAGEVYASTPYTSQFTDSEVVCVAVPIFVDDYIDGVLAVEYCTNYLDTLLTTFTDNRGLNLVVDAGSNIILSTNSHVISFDAFKNAIFEDGITFEKVTDDFGQRKSGSISYTLNGVRKFGEYRPIEINDWMLFFEISEENLNDSVHNISSAMILTSAMIIVCALIALIYIILSKNKHAKSLEEVAYYDELTAIPNMIKFKMDVAEAIKKDPHDTYTMVKMDIVNFKAINDMFGYEEGNNVICAVAETGKNINEDKFIQARVAAEEFMFFAGGSLLKNLEQNAANYEQLFKDAMPHLADHHFEFRYGRYFLKPGENDVNDIVHKTNIAHAFAKKDNSSNIWDYDENFTKKVLRDTELANKMHKALSNQEFKAFLQPKFSVIDGKICGAEALVRWVEADNSMIYPNEFIPLFEQNGFIVELDKYMLRCVCAALKKWCTMGKPCVPISINFSRLHLRNANFVEDIHAITTEYGISPELIEIELTESTVMENEQTLHKILNELHKIGFCVSIDDFGSGYSSLGMLKDFKMDTLKLDKSFFGDEADEADHHRGNLVVESIVALAANLGMHTIAEGIEKKYQEAFLRKIKCDAAQGYLYAKPMPIDAFEELFYGQKL